MERRRPPRPPNRGLPAKSRASTYSPAGPGAETSLSPPSSPPTSPIIQQLYGKSQDVPLISSETSSSPPSPGTPSSTSPYTNPSSLHTTKEGFDEWKKRTDQLAAAVLAAARIGGSPRSRAMQEQQSTEKHKTERSPGERGREIVSEGEGEYHTTDQPHATSALPVEDARENREQDGSVMDSGSDALVGLGIVFTDAGPTADVRISVRSVVRDGPASQATHVPLQGDRLVSIAGVDATQMSLAELRTHALGKVGTCVDAMFLTVEGRAYRTRITRSRSLPAAHAHRDAGDEHRAAHQRASDTSMEARKDLTRVEGWEARRAAVDAALLSWPATITSILSQRGKDEAVMWIKSEAEKMVQDALMRERALKEELHVWKEKTLFRAKLEEEARLRLELDCERLAKEIVEEKGKARSESVRREALEKRLKDVEQQVLALSNASLLSNTTTFSNGAKSSNGSPPLHSTSPRSVRFELMQTDKLKDDREWTPLRQTHAVGRRTYVGEMDAKSAGSMLMMDEGREAPELSDEESNAVSYDKDRKPVARRLLERAAEHNSPPDLDDEMSADLQSQSELARVALGPRDDSAAPPFTGPRPPAGLPGAYY